MASVCIYCGSSPGADPAFMRSAAEMGALLARSGHTLVYGGGNTGLMGAAANGALAAGGEVIGVIPDILVAKELAHTGLTRLHVVRSMHERKFLMADLSDAFIALPGGTGTLEEIIEVFVWTQLGVHMKSCGVLNVDGFYDPLIDLLRHMAANRFLRVEQLNQLIIGSDPEELLRSVLSFRPVLVDKWMREIG